MQWLFYIRILVSTGVLESISHCHLETTIVYVSVLKHFGVLARSFQGLLPFVMATGYV